MLNRRPPLVALARLACATALVACAPEPKVEPQVGRVVAVANESTFQSVVSAGLHDCRQQVQPAPDADDYTSIVVAVDVLSAAVGPDNRHSARIDANALLSFEHDGPDDGLSAIRFTSRIESNRSATGYASASTFHRCSSPL